MEGGLHLTCSRPRGREGRWPECQALPPRASSHQLPVSAGVTGIQGNASWWSDLIVDVKALSWGHLLMTSSKPNTLPFLSVLPLDPLISTACELSFIDIVETSATAVVSLLQSCSGEKC